MESYRVLNRLGKGAQGSVYLVEHRGDGSHYVLKKIECKDEGEANASFQEEAESILLNGISSQAMVLRELDFPSICVYREFFVIWDAEDCAINFCLVMDYYCHGDLKTVMRMKREKNEPIAEALIKTWLGQMVAGLVYINEKGIIHRDLKPSNIFLQDEGNVRIGDFGVATVMKDAKDHRRSIIGTSRYIAPESWRGEFSEKSDTWSLGVILLELMRCHCDEAGDTDGENIPINYVDIVQKLQSGDLCEIYSEELRGLVVQLLEENPEKRPSAESLMRNNDFVRMCVDMTDKTKIEKRKRKTSASIQRFSQPTTRDPSTLIQYIKAIQYDESKVHPALLLLVDILQDKEQTTLTGVEKVVITDVMKNNLEDVSVQIAACDVLNAVIISASADDILFSKETIAVILAAIKNHLDVTEFIQKACYFLSACTEEENCCMIIGQLGGIHCILNCLNQSMTDSSLVGSVCEVLWNLAVHEKNAAILTSLNGIKVMSETLKMNMDKVEVVEPVAATLLSLAMEEENLKYVNELHTVTLLMEVISKHYLNAKVVKNSCFALATFSEIHEESAFNVLKGFISEQADLSGLSILLSAYECHRDNAEVVEAIVTLIHEMSVYQEIKLEMQYVKLGETLLFEVHKRFKENKDIIGPCESAMTNLGMPLNDAKSKIPHFGP